MLLESACSAGKERSDSITGDALESGGRDRAGQRCGIFERDACGSREDSEEMKRARKPRDVDM